MFSLLEQRYDVHIPIIRRALVCTHRSRNVPPVRYDRFLHIVSCYKTLNAVRETKHGLRWTREVCLYPSTAARRRGCSP